MFSGVCVFSNTGSSAFDLLRNVTLGSFLEADQLREIIVPLQPHACNARVTEKYRSSVTSCRSTSALPTQIAHSLNGGGGGGAFAGICAH